MKKRIKYRIVTDEYLGYEVQAEKRFLFWTWWEQVNFVNTHFTLENAKEYINKKCSEKYKVVWTSDDDNKQGDREMNDIVTEKRILMHFIDGYKDGIVHREIIEQRLNMFIIAVADLQRRWIAFEKDDGSIIRCSLIDFKGA